MPTKERATVTLTAKTLQEAREIVPDLNLSALFDDALAQRVHQAREAQMARSYAEHPSDYDDNVDWGAIYGVSAEEQSRAMAARRPWKADE